MRVETHLHIRRFLAGFPAALSVRDLPNGKVRYAGYVTLDSATFAVQPAGLIKFRRDKTKNVHAFVRGLLVEERRYTFPFEADYMTRLGFAQVRYNPAEMDTFQTVGGVPVFKAQRVIVAGKNIYARGLS